ncbi:MAG: hypothetical protein LAQ69_42005 [Acidobacteriia bacterium]|nr:hypothetical protein [Terriglobia bacterium]
MPEPILFAPCEKVILDTDGLVSLITVIERLEVTVPPGIQLPPNAAIPQRWQSLAIWRLEESEAGQYEQMTDLIVPDGSVAMHTEPMALKPTTPGRATGAKIISTLTLVPLTDGPLRLRLFYRRIGEQEWTPAAAYPVDVVLIRK